MEKKFHICRSADIEFTQDEWSQYLNAVYAGERERITTQYGQYIYNEHDICLNPSKQEIASKGGAYGYSVTIKWAMGGNGIWAYGLDYECGTAGGGFGVSWTDTTDESLWHHGYASEKDCKVAGMQKAIKVLNHCADPNRTQVSRLRLMIEDEIKKLTRPQVVQLELFG